MARRTGPKTSHKQKQKPKSKRESASRTAPTAAATSRGAAPFPKKDRPPSEAEFLARIPVAAGKKLESLRTFLGKQRGVAESLFFFGPKTGWAYRYLRGEQSVATLMLHAGQLTGIVALDGPALAKIDFAALSPAAAAARKAAHGSPSLSWLDLPVDGTGAGDFKVLVRAKLRTMPPPPTAEPSARPARAAADPGQTSGSTRRRLPPPPPPSAHSPPASADGAGPIEADVAPRPPGRTNRR
jgi:hypothetical protein